MMTRATGRPSARTLRGALVCAVLAAVAVSPGRAAGDVSRGDIEAAEERYARLQGEIAGLQEELEEIQSRGNKVVGELLRASTELEATRRRLLETQARLDDARALYDERVRLFEERVREAFIRGGGATSLNFLLSADTLADFADRLEFVDRVASSDAAAAAEVAAVKARLAREARELERLKAHQLDVAQELQARELELERQFAEQQALIDGIQAKREAAAAALQGLRERRRRQIEARYATLVAGGEVVSGPFEVCPVGQPRAFGDDFGAPRYSGGYHPHAGNDILAPAGTPIYAPFDGIASDASNGLGGLSVKVRGAAGYVYNAHLSQLGLLGEVRAGDVIGYVGTSGNAVGGPAHDHFEWHPNVIPASWPVSSYGESVIGDAINPYPLLTQVC
jgi:peptidoglycan hydrolase CwlO-like protein